jgi:putative FmdB family regulatory protein
MPLYEYQCSKCGHRFEKIQSFSAEPIKECPVCGGATERLISAPAIQFKGSGFYSTDYGSKPARRSSSSEGGSDAKASSEKSAGSADKSASAKTESAKTESKAASPSPSKSTSD